MHYFAILALSFFFNNSFFFFFLSNSCSSFCIKYHPHVINPVTHTFNTVLFRAWTDICGYTSASWLLNTTWCYLWGRLNESEKFRCKKWWHCRCHCVHKVQGSEVLQKWLLCHLQTFSWQYKGLLPFTRREEANYIMYSIESTNYEIMHTNLFFLLLHDTSCAPYDDNH